MLPLFSRAVKLGNITYNLYSHSFLHFGLVIIILFAVLSMFFRLIFMCVSTDVLHIKSQFTNDVPLKKVTTNEIFVLMLLLFTF